MFVTNKVTPEIVPLSESNITMRCHCKQSRNPHVGIFYFAYNQGNHRNAKQDAARVEMLNS